MAKKEEVQSFEKTEYGEDDGVYEKFQTIKQIVADIVKARPNIGCDVKLTYNSMKLFCFSYESGLPQAMGRVEEEHKKVLDEVLKHIKKEFKSRTKKVLDMKEVGKWDPSKCMNVEKVSLNDRHTCISWRTFELT